jgi:hypothetical protein
MIDKTRTSGRRERTTPQQNSVVAKIARAAVYALPCDTRLLLCPENSIFRCFGDSEFDHCLGWNLDLLLGLGIDAGTGFSLLFQQFAKTGQDEFSILLDLFVGKLSERIKK